jgi:molybdate transport system substrate-binding protein
MIKTVNILASWIIVTALSTSAHAADTSAASLLVYGAASLTNVLDEIGNSYTHDTGQSVKFSYGSSSALAKQIEAGAKADIFFSADSDWMDYLQNKSLINNSSRQSLLGNTLVLIAPASSSFQLKIVPNFALAATLGKERLATGDPDSVPVGKYARAALTTLGVWNDVADKLVRADNVRTALTFVDRAEVPLGIVYETDALVDNKVRIVDRFPANTHPPIVYPVALTISASPDAAKFVAYLRSPAAKTTFKKYGFTLLQ